MAATHPVLNFARLHPMAPASIPQADPGYDIESWSEKNARIAAIRKERSRDAARSRRGKENYEFYELAKLLPLPAAITSQLDKASIIRLTIGYLHMRHFCIQGDPPWHNYPETVSTPTNSSRHLSVLQGRYPHVQSGTNAIAREVYEHHLGSHILQSLDGFLFALYRDGRFLYISETVSIYLGLSQVELMGCSIFDYVHPNDHAELAEQLGMKLPPNNKPSSSPSSTNADGNSNPGSGAASPSAIGPSNLDDVTLNMATTSDRIERSFLIRMKSTLTKRGVHFKSSGYKVIHITGALRPELSLSQYNHHPPNILGFVGVGYSLPPPTISEVRLDPTMFMCKVDLDFTITFCEAKISDFLDHQADSVIGKSFYSFIHAQDLANIRDSHQDLLNKGQTITKYFRWMLKEGGFIWIQTTATLCYAKNSNDSYFIFINQVISHVEHGDIPMDIRQIPLLASDEHIELLETSPTRIKTSPSHHSGEETDVGPSHQLSTDGDSNNNSKGHQSLPESKSRKRPQSPERKRSKKHRGAQITRNIETGSIHGDTDHKSEMSGRESKRKANARLVGQKPKALQESVVPKQVIIRADSPNEKTLTVLGERGDFRESSEEFTKRSKERLHHSEERIEEVVEDAGLHQSPTAITTDDHLQASSSLLALSVRNASRHEGDTIVRVPSGSWENPPNRELPLDHNGLIPSPDTSHSHLGLAPMNSMPKGVFTTPSPKTPESLLTPPLSDSAKNQFSLPPVSSITSPKPTRPTNTDSITPIITTDNSISRYGSTASSKHETVYPIPSPLMQNTSVESLDSMRNMVKQEPSFYNARMLGMPSSYTNMAAYANYGQYNNLQHYTSRAYQAAAATYDASMYKNYHTTTDLPIDLSYNGVTGIPIMPPANGPYFPAAPRLQYNITDGQLSLNCDKGGMDKSKSTSV